MIKTFQAVFNEAKNKGVYSISLVDDPAMEGEFIALSKNVKVELKTLDEEQRIIIGLVLEPNKPIYRNQNGEEFNIVFSEDTIKELSHNFFKQGYQTNSSIEHDGKSIDGISFVESWLVLDSDKDKSSVLGFSYPKGSWLATMKVDSDEIWNDYIKTGKVQGFSIDAFVELQEVKLNKQTMEKTILEAIKDIPNAIKLALTPKEDEVKLGSVKTVEGMDFMFDGEALSVGSPIWILAEDGETKVAVPVGEHPLEDGKILVVSEEGIAGEIKDAMQEEPAELDVVAPTATAEPKAMDVVNDIKSLLIKYSEDAKAERLEFEKTINEKLEKFDGQLVEFSNEPAAKSIQSNIKPVSLNKTGRLLNKIRNNK